MRILSDITDDFWWDVARRCNYTTFYQTPIWRDLAIGVSLGYRDETFGAILPSGVHVVFPIISSRRLGPLRWLESTYEGCYGGPIADGPISPSEMIEIYKRATPYSTYTLRFLENPLGSPLQDELKSRFTCIVNETALMLRLDADFDTIFSHFSRTQRNSYRKGIKNGVTIRLATSYDDYQTYYATYRDAVDRWGQDEGYGYNWHLFEQLYEMSRIHPKHIKLWLMIFEEQIVGGRIVFYWGSQATGWNGTAHREFLKYNVIPVTDTEIIRDAITQGYAYFDFNTSSLNPGVIAYKQRFNPESFPVNVWLFDNPLLKPVQHLYWNLKIRRSQRSSSSQEQLKQDHSQEREIHEN